MVTLVVIVVHLEIKDNSLRYLCGQLLVSLDCINASDVDCYDHLREQQEDQEELLRERNDWPSVYCERVRNSRLPEPYGRLLRWTGFMPFSDSRLPASRIDLALSILRMALLPLLCVVAISMVTLRWPVDLKGDRLIQVPRPSLDMLDKIIIGGRNIVLFLNGLLFVCLEIRFCHQRKLHVPMALIDDPRTCKKMCRWHFGFIAVATSLTAVAVQALIIIDMGKPTDSTGLGQVVVGVGILFCCVTVLAFYMAVALDVFLFMCHAHIEAALAFKRQLARTYSAINACRSTPSHVYELISIHGQIITAMHASSDAWKGIIVLSLPIGLISVLYSVLMITTSNATHFEVPMIVVLGILVIGMVYQLVLVGMANQSIVGQANIVYLSHRHLQGDEAKASFLDNINTLMAYLTSSNPYWKCFVDVTPDKAAIVCSLFLSLATYILPFLENLYVPK